MPMPTMLVLPWQRTEEPRPKNALLFASRFDGTGLHRNAVASMTDLGPARGVLVSRDAQPRQRPAWRDTMRWLAAQYPGPYRHVHEPSPVQPDPAAPVP